MLSTVPRLFAAALFAVALFAVVLPLAIAPARSAETATPDDTARFLAGLPPAQNSPLAALAKDPGWAQHAHFFDSIFSREDANTLSKVRAFAKEHLAAHSDAMLYMFSGPDFLYATSFFPSASTYVLSGLEPVGDVPQLTSLPRGAVDFKPAQYRGLAGHHPQLELLHHQKYEDAADLGPGLRHAADPLCFPGPHRQDRPRGEPGQCRCPRQCRCGGGTRHQAARGERKAPPRA